MKSIKNLSITSSVPLLAMCLLGLCLVHLSGCGSKSGDPTPSAQEEVKTKLTATTKWTLQSATVDGVDKTSVYTGLTISFSETAYSTTNGGSLWPPSGTWSFVAADGKVIKREDGTEINVEVTENSLKLSFAWAKTTLGTGRTESISGQHILTFSK